MLLNLQYGDVNEEIELVSEKLGIKIHQIENINNFYNLEIEGGEHTYLVEGVIASGLGDNKELNEKYQRQPKELTKHL